MEEENLKIEEESSHKPLKKRDILFIVLKRHKIGLLIVVFLIMVSSTFAWFINNKTVDLSLHAHVKAWNIALGNDEDDGTYVIEIADLYPGMATIDTSNGAGIPIYNNGEIDANIAIDIVSITLFGKLQSANDYTVEKYTDTDVVKFVIKGYPFVLSFALSTDYLTAGDSTTLNYILEWEYEKYDNTQCSFSNDEVTIDNCDDFDTYFGEKAYEFSSNPDNQGLSSLVIQLKMNVTQAN